MKTRFIATILVLQLIACSRQGDYKLHLLFDNVNGLTTKSEVLFNGLKIGTVEELKVLRNKILVTASINKEVQIPLNSTFTLTNVDLLGEKAITVKFDGSRTKHYENNDTIHGKLSITDSAQFKLDSVTAKNLQPIVDTLANAIRDFGKELKNN